jgi:integrase
MDSRKRNHREPVFSGSQRVRGLYVRTLGDGSKVYEFAGRVDGKVRSQRLEAKTKTGAIQEVHAILAGAPSKAKGATLNDLAADWLTHLEARVDHRDVRKRYSRRTVDLYRQRLDSHVLPLLGHRAVTTLTPHDAGRFADSMRSLSGSTVTGTLNILGGLLRYARKADPSVPNIVRDLDRDDRPGAARETEPRYLTSDELDRLLYAMSSTFRPVAATCAFASLRVSEALGLTWSDIDFEAGTLRVERQLSPDGKRVALKSAASARTVPLLPRLANELKALRTREAAKGFARVKPDSLAFVTSRGKPQSRRNALRAVHAAGDAAGLNPEGRQPVGLHDLRHSFAAVALAHGLSIAEVAGLMGHANARVTSQMYAGLTDNALDVAASKLAASGFGA